MVARADRGRRRLRRSSARLGYTLALPIVALLAASAVLGPEIDDGSIVYLIAKPVPRHVVVLSKYVVAWLATVGLGALPLLLAGLVLDFSAPGRAVAWGVAALVSGTAYTALFLGLAALTRHAVVIGLLFVLLVGGAARRAAVRHPLAGDRAVGHARWGPRSATRSTSRAPASTYALFRGPSR